METMKLELYEPNIALIKELMDLTDEWLKLLDKNPIMVVKMDVKMSEDEQHTSIMELERIGNSDEYKNYLIKSKVMEDRLKIIHELLK